MNSHQTIDALIDCNIVEMGNQSEELTLTAEFREALGANQDRIAESTSNLQSEIESLLESNEQVQQFQELATNMPEFVARFLTLAEFVADQTVDERVQMTLVLDRFFRPPPPEGGAPDPFFALHGDQLGIVSICSKAIVYVWRDECKPCDQMKRIFEEIFSEGNEDIAGFAVYGPDWTAELRENYNVTAGPTTLFVVGGRVDARLLGSHHKKTIEAEIEELRASSAMT